MTGIWKGADPYSGDTVPVPDVFDETRQRKVGLFRPLLSLLNEAARPIELSQLELEHWFARATDIIARAEAMG